MNNESIRIAKAISRAGVASRREAERLIENHHVCLNGVILTSCAINVTDSDEIMVYNKIIDHKIQKDKIWRYHKPPGLIVSHRDPENRPSIFDHLPKSLPRLISVGRLDMMSEGLMILTNSGNLSRYMEIPANKIERIYQVHVFGHLNRKLFDISKEGIIINDEFFRPEGVNLLDSYKNNHVIEIILTEGKNREIRKILSFFNLKIGKLIRVSYGGFNLDGLTPLQIEEVDDVILNKMSFFQKYCKIMQKHT